MKKTIEIFMKNKVFLILIVAGAVLMLMPDLFYDKKTDQNPDVSLVLEEKIEKTIEDTYNIKHCSVILTYDTNGEKLIQNNTSTFSSEPIVKSEKLPYVRGVMISANGINNSISEEICNSVAVLLGVNPSKVTVIYK